MHDILTQKLAELEDMCRNAMRRGDALEAELGAMRRELDAMRRERDVLNRELSDLSELADSFEAQINGLQKRASSCEEVILSLQRERDALKSLLSLGRYTEGERRAVHPGEFASTF